MNAYAYLEDSWEIKDGQFEVWGEVQFLDDQPWGLLKEARSLSNNKLLKYPLENYNNSRGFYVSPIDVKNLSKYKKPVFIRCKLELSPLSEREKHGIPFEMQVTPNTFELLKKIPGEIALEGNNSFFIEKRFFDFYDKKTKEEISTLYQKEKEKIDELELQYIDKLNEYNELLKNNLSLASQKQELEKLVNYINVKKIAMENNFHQMEIEMNSKITRLKSYIADKALFLKTFEFIDEEDIENFLFESKLRHEVNIDGIVFRKDLEGDYQKAVSYIQAHLVENDILYPRHILENYITLLRTKDLIILAGDSGSGKTNLVKSFAKAVGGKSIIVPVKPNWTSSEDLLGYYNPLEKKYLATPFLEALLEAHKNPNIPYFICLDEMNLARVEYYFADFLSLLESRDEEPEIVLYADNESSHVLSELKAVFEIIQAGKEKYKKDGVVDFIKLLQDDDLNIHLRKSFRFSDKDSLIKYHSEVRRMLSTVMTMPSTIKMPHNIYIIGAINIDETTHYLSPKILDRAHIMRFESPLLSAWDEILAEVDEYDFDDVTKPLLFEIEELGVRKTYPKFNREDDFCKLFVELNKEFFHKLGVEFGMRTIRQGLNYIALFKDVNDNPYQAVNNFLLHKVLPKFTFDGNKNMGEQTKLDLIEKIFLERIKQELPSYETFPDIFSAVSALEKLVANASVHDKKCKKLILFGFH